MNSQASLGCKMFYLAGWAGLAVGITAGICSVAIGGLCLGVVAIIAFPAFLLVAPAAAALYRWLVSVGEGAPARAAVSPSPLEMWAPARTPVTREVMVRVRQASGTCPRGFTFREGTRYVFRNGSVEPELCPIAMAKLRPLVAAFARGEHPKSLFPFCSSKQHDVVFEFQGVETRVAETTPA